jgi:uncharacterized protein YjgD (DUF1641 family)
MAEAITKIAQSPDVEKTKVTAQLSELISQLSTNTDVLSEGLNLLQAMHRRGVLELLTALFERGDKLAVQWMEILAQPGSVNVLKLVMAVADGLTSYDAEAVNRSLKSLSGGLDSALAAPRPEKPLSVFDILKLTRDPDVAIAVNAGFAFLRGVGQSLSSTSRAEGES